MYEKTLWCFLIFNVMCVLASWGVTVYAFMKRRYEKRFTVYLILESTLLFLYVCVGCYFWQWPIAGLVGSYFWPCVFILSSVPFACFPFMNELRIYAAKRDSVEPLSYIYVGLLLGMWQVFMTITVYAILRAYVLAVKSGLTS